MKMKTGLLALGLFTIAGAVTVSCGGSSDDGDSSGTSGSSTTAGTTGTGGSSSTAGTSSSAGTSNSSAGTSNSTAGTSSGGTSSNGGTSSGGTNNGGTNNGGANSGGNDPGAGGDNATGCPATQPMDGDACMRGDGGFFGCTYGDQVCRCTRQGQQMRSWQCDTAQNPGAGGDNGGFGDATCPDNAMDNDACTGAGPCPGQQGCFCFQEMVNCF